MSNTITQRIYDFLKDYPPFNFISTNQLINISSKVQVLYFTEGDVVFYEDEQPPKYFYIVKDGLVQLFTNYKTNKVLIDICDEGDIFGIRPIFSDNFNYTLTAVVSEESLIYKIPVSDVKQIIKENKNVENYFASAFIAGIRKPYKQLQSSVFSETNKNLNNDEILIPTQSIIYTNNPITCNKETTIKHTALKMREHRVGSIIIVDINQFPIGIITDRDLRNKVVTGDVCNDCSVSEIMSSPVITTGPDTSISDIQIIMIKNNIHHICITEDGTDQSKLLGIVSEHDILLQYGNNPSVLIREIRRSNNESQLKHIRDKLEVLLKSYLKQEVSLSYISHIVTEVNTAIYLRAIDIEIEKLKDKGINTPDIKWCWLALGSQGREEQLVRSDQDSAIIFQNVEDSKYEEVKNYFIQLAEGVTKTLHHCGFQYCPANIMASNPRWCMSIDKWKSIFNKWIFTPGEKEVMYSTIFFDFNPIYGDKHLTDELTDSIFNAISEQESFLSFLARNALESPPPLSFFRGFMVEHNGEHKDEFDIKARAIMPLVDGARVLTLSSKLKGINNTVKRFIKLAEIEPQNKALFEELADATEIIMKFRALQGLRHNNTGRYIKPDELNKMERLMLRNCFTPIKELQTLLTVRFNLKMFR